MRCLYVDLDGTLLGRGASLLSDGDGGFSLLGMRAFEACARVDAEVVLYSGRRRAELAEDARRVGCSAFVFEAGACLVLDGEDVWLTGALEPVVKDGREHTIFEQVADSG